MNENLSSKPEGVPTLNGAPDSRAEHFTKILRNFVALSNQISEFMVKPSPTHPGEGELSDEVKTCLNRLTEAGMWFRMSFDVERAGEPRVAGVILKERENGRVVSEPSH